MKHLIDITVTTGKSAYNDTPYAIGNLHLQQKGAIDKTTDVHLRNIF